MEVDVCTRLYLNQKTTIKVEKTPNDALISDLPGHTIKWIKNRRRLDCNAKMVLSHNRERQLRDIFNGIDVGKNGFIDLVELHEAVKFVAERMKNKLGTFDGFNNILKIFDSMDDNGDGKVDFQEFTNAMSGSSKSALDKASEQDIANLHRCFLEFGVMKQRRYAIAKINDYTGISFAGESNLKSAKFADQEEEDGRNKKTGKLSDEVMVNDLNKYRLFRTLFESKRDPTSHIRDAEGELLEEGEKRLTVDEILLKQFQAENKLLHMGDSSDAQKEADYDALHRRLKDARIQAAKELAKDPEAMALQAMHEEGLKYFAAMRRQRPHTASNPYLVTVDGKPITNSLGFPTSMPVKQPVSKEDLAIQLAAKRDAYDVMRSIRFQRPAEQQRNYLEQHSAAAGFMPLRIPTLDTYAEESSLNLNQSQTSSMEYSRHSSNLPTNRSRQARARSAIRKTQSLDALLSGPALTRAEEAARVVRLTSHAAVLTSASPIASARPLSAYQAISRPSTANAAMKAIASLGKNASTGSGVKAATPKAATSQIYTLRSPKTTLSFGT